MSNVTLKHTPSHTQPYDSFSSSLFNKLIANLVVVMSYSILACIHLKKFCPLLLLYPQQVKVFSNYSNLLLYARHGGVSHRHGGVSHRHDGVSHRRGGLSGKVLACGAFKSC